MPLVPRRSKSLESPVKIVSGDLWDRHREGAFVVVTTNGSIRKDGRAVMGRGIALEASERFPELQVRLARLIERFGNHVQLFESERLILFPVKDRWHEKAKMDLILQSALELRLLLVENPKVQPVFMPMPGCGAGGLAWHDVASILAPLADFVTICDRTGWYYHDGGADAESVEIVRPVDRA